MIERDATRAVPMVETAALLTNGKFPEPFAKTAHGMVRGPSRYRVVGVVDSAIAGQDAGAVLDGVARGIPAFATLQQLLAGVGERPQWCVVAVATSGGVLPAGFREVLLEAVEAGMGVVCGLHQLLSEDAELVAAARRRGVQLIDIRRPRPRSELRFWSGAVRRVRAPRIAVLGTDCALGKRTTCGLLLEACRATGLRAEMVYTGQTGWLQGLEWGFVLDATPNDFVSGELERQIVRCDEDASPDVILLEGQSALRNPSGPCGAELLLSGQARGVVLQHAPGRRCFEDQEDLDSVIPSLESEIALIGHYGARVLAVTLNDDGVAAEQRAAVADRIATAIGVPALWPLHDGLDSLAIRIRSHLDELGAP